VPQAEGQLKENNPLKHKLILASKSARRAEILRAVGWPFESIASNVNETRAPSEDAVSYVERLAREKAETVAAKVSSGLVLGGDTVVVIDDEILGQPRDADDARRMLRLLSGKWHEVVTGVALAPAGQVSRTQVDHEITRVHFANMSDEEMEWYVATGEPMDKAGAYAIQGRAALFIEEIEGDYFNIVGLPVRLVFELVRRMAL
jgi:nucleoside triphosphate pyrophosphatase